MNCKSTTLFSPTTANLSSRSRQELITSTRGFNGENCRGIVSRHEGFKIGVKLKLLVMVLKKNPPDSALLYSLHDAAAKENPNQSGHAAFLFPVTDPTPSMEINQWKSSFGDDDSNKFVLIAFDGTWKHAKEMVFASFPFLSKFATLEGTFWWVHEYNGGSCTMFTSS
ncbi:hypothetical protein L2E82_16755 [Cichorium intybus]|uniref:Uncharacterized protein n=1 Tax=Cichorium intybus TaxID=13427 RepID=A0ACB9F6W3_CICIN|nr:hypothetical protein L2E82_16755 [Cichorium intybus]